MLQFLIPYEFAELKNRSWVQQNVEKIVLENTADNHYKYYHLSQEKDTPKPGRIFEVRYGRIGSKAQKTLYDDRPGVDIWTQMQSKLKKGYKIKLFVKFGQICYDYDKFIRDLGDTDLFD